jgi:quercetin dioxygenase-like cupin family protein
MTYPKTNIGCVANLYSRQMHFQKSGDVELGHRHSFDHLTLLAYGTLKVKVNGKETTFVAPHMIYIAKDLLHELTALEDNTLAFCIHPLRDGNGVDDILDPTMIPEGVNPLASGLAKPLTY